MSFRLKALTEMSQNMLKTIKNYSAYNVHLHQGPWYISSDTVPCKPIEIKELKLIMESLKWTIILIRFRPMFVVTCITEYIKLEKYTTELFVRKSSIIQLTYQIL